VTVLWEQRRTRTFGWGAVYICDAERYEPDDHEFHKGGPLSAEPDDVAVATVHAGAADPAEADVELLAQVLDRTLPSAGYTTVSGLVRRH
jgi:hypothetical protein